MSLDPIMQRVNRNIDEHISQLMQCKPLSEQESDPYAEMFDNPRSRAAFSAFMQSFHGDEDNDGNDGNEGDDE